jgi:hypothetical protein
MTRITTLDIPKEDPFLNCKLDREPYGNVLTDVVRTNSDGFVLAINNKWGAGKTTFISMWKQQLENQDFQTLYFNAWENDFENNPFVALTAELKTIIKNKNSETFNEILKKGSTIAQAAIPSILKSIVKKYGGEDLADIMENYSEGVLEAFKEDIDSYIERKQTMSDFRDELQKYIQENSNGRPIVFIIDELDRCRPNYAVSILENVKHLFSVKGVVFVLSIDKEQLGHAICGAYGSDKINANEYLRRFIDIEYTLPSPEIKRYISYLMEACKLNDFFNLGERKKIRELSRDESDFINHAILLFELKNLTLRQQEKIFRHAGIVLRSFSERQYIIPELLVYLIYLKIFHSTFYEDIKGRKLTHQQLIDNSAQILSGNVNDYKNRFRINIEAIILVYYNEYYDNFGKITIEYDIKEDDSFEIKSFFDQSPNQVDFKRCIAQERNHYHRSRTSIDYLLKKIDLLESLKDF